MDVLRTECEQGSAFGFTGKQAIHPDQIPIIHETFSPSKEEVEHAARLMMQFMEERNQGNRGAWEFEGKMVDLPVVRKASKVLHQAVSWNIEKDVAAGILEALSKRNGLDEGVLHSVSEFNPPEEEEPKETKN